MKRAVEIIKLILAGTYITTKSNSFRLGYFSNYLGYTHCKFVLFFVMSVSYYRDYNTSGLVCGNFFFFVCLFLGMVMYANKVEEQTKNYLR